MIDEELVQQLKEYNKRRKAKVDFEKDKKLESLLCSRYNKIGRIKKHFVYMYHRKKNLYFLTFTFNEKYINKCDRTKKDLIKNCLYEFDALGLYILNVDYGSQTERQHFHCIFGTNKDIDLKKYLDKYYPCFSYTEKIRTDENSLKKLPKYIDKLSNHAIKKSTRASRIVFNFKGYGDTSVPEVREMYLLDKMLIDELA